MTNAVAVDIVNMLQAVQDFLSTHAAHATKEDAEVVQSAQYATVSRQL